MPLFRKVLSAFRIVASMPPANTIQPLGSGFRNGDLSCDEDGALWTRVTAGGGGSGSLGLSGTFSSAGATAGFVQQYTVTPLLTPTEIALQSIHAHAAEACYLQLFETDTPVDGNACAFEWAVPYEQGFNQEFGFPWGLRVPGLTFIFSSTQGFLTTGPYGYVHGIYSYTGT